MKAYHNVKLSTEIKEDEAVADEELVSTDTDAV